KLLPYTMLFRSEHHADLLTQLVNEDRSRTSLVQRASHLAKGLAHQSSLETHVGISHFAVDLCLGGQCGNGVNDDHIDRTRSHQHVRNFEGLLTRIWLGDQ